MLNSIWFIGLWLLIGSFVGHVLWSMLIGLVRSIIGKACPQCGSVLSLQGKCAKCVRRAAQTKPSLANDLLAAQRLIQFAQAKSVLGAEELRQFRSSIQALQRAELEQSVLRGPVPQSQHASPVPISTDPPVLDVHSSPAPTDERQRAPLPFPTTARSDVPPTESLDSGKPGEVPTGTIPTSRYPGGSIPPLRPTTQPHGSEASASSNRTSPVFEARRVENQSQVGRREPQPVHPLEVHPLDAPDDDVVSPAAGRVQVPSLPQVQNAARQWTAEMITSFMERSNIRWIELTAATLIVVCSVGLVISLWSTLSSTSRFFPSIVFMIATLAVHGAGQYTLKQWRLKNTSRGILNVALMLIPLSVMIGILLSRREGDWVLDWQFYSVLGLAVIVYSGLAVTAAKSLFSQAWLPVAVSNIVASVSLLLIAIAAKREVSLSQAASLLVPIAVTTMAFAWDLSWSAGIRQQPTLGFLRRQTGVVCQILFASLAVLIFWRMQLRGSSGLNTTWIQEDNAVSITQANTWAWLVIGGWAGAWACWGAINSPMHRSTQSRWLSAVGLGAKQGRRLGSGGTGSPLRTVNRGPEISSLLIFCWFIGFAAAGLFFFAAWQLSLDRVPLLLLFGVVGGWLWSLGYLTRSTLAVSMGGFLNLVALSIGMESWFTGSVPMAWSDWVSFERVGSLGGLGVVVAGVTQAMFGYRSAGAGVEESSLPWSLLPSWRMRWRARGSIDLFATGMRVAAWLAIGLSVGLTLLAIGVPRGRTPNGGDWAPVLLGVHGLLIAVAGQAWVPHRVWVRWLGQVLGVLAMVRICMDATWLPESFAQWRPWLVLAIGGSVLAGVWSIASGLLLWAERRFRLRPHVLSADIVDRGSFGFSDSTIALALASSIGLWFTREPLQLVLAWGWMLPVVLALHGVVRREAVLGQSAWIAAMVWVLAIVFRLGETAGVWQGLGPMASLSAWVAIACCLWIPYEIGSRWMRVSLSWDSQEAPLESSPMWFGYDLMLSVLALSVFGTTVGLLGISLGSMDRNDLPWWLLSPEPAQQRWYFATTAIAIGVWILATRWRRGWGTQNASHAIMGVALWLLVMLLGTHGMPGSAWHATAWLVSGLTTISLIWGGWRASRRVDLQEVKNGGGIPSIDAAQRDRMVPDWLASWNQMGAVILALMVLPLLGVSGWFGARVETVSNAVVPSWFADQWGSSDSATRIAALVLWFGPLLCVAVAQWLMAMVRGRATREILGTGVWLASWTALLMIMLSAQPYLDVSSRLMVWFQSIAIGFAAISLGTSLFASRWIRMRLDGQITRPSVTSDHQDGDVCRPVAGWLSRIAIAPIVGISLLSLWSNIDCAMHFPFGASSWLLPTVAAFGLFFLAIFASAETRRLDRSVFVMLVIALTAPVIAHHSVDFLTRGWGRVPSPMLEYRAEPLHATLLLWLIALAVGLSQRSLAAQPTTRGNWVNGLWFTLAWMIALLGLWQLRGVWVGWSLAMESGLALLLVLRGLRTSMPALGHVAAVLGAIAVSLTLWPWLFRESWLRGSAVLWSPILCGWISLGWQLIFQGGGLDRTGETGATVGPGDSRVTGGSIVADRNGYSTLWATIDQSASLHVPLAMILWSGLAMVSGEALRARLQVHWGENLGLAIGALGLAIARMWDSRSGSRGWGVYLNGLSVALTSAALLPGLTSDRLDERFLLWVLSGLGAMTLMVVCLREWLRESSRLIPALRLGMLAPRQHEFVRASVWMAGSHTLAGLVLIGPCVLLVLGDHPAFTQRLAALIPCLSALTILPIASQLSYRLPRIASMLLVSVAAVLIGWSGLAQSTLAHSSAGWGTVSGGGSWWELHFHWAHWQRAFVILVALLWVYRWFAERLRNRLDWGSILHASSSVCVVAAFASGLLSLLGIAYSMRDAESLVSNPWGMGWDTFGAWVALAARMLQLAFRPTGLDSGISRHARQWALYASEAALIAGVCGLRLQFPWLFRGIIAEWWPILFYVLAMGSIAIENWYRRRGDGMFTHPVLLHCLLLPVIPLVGAWATPMFEVTAAWREPLSYSMLLLASAVVYGTLGRQRGATPIKIASIGMLLASFWVSLTSQDGLGFWEHPQLWIIPPALATLIFIERNQGQLAPTAVTGTRYLAILFIYASSTVEMVFHAFELQFWTPVLLLALAVAGVMAGIALRVRAFLYCGGAFVMIALIGMVWHAQQAIQQVWPWWVLGIVMGIALIVLIGTFEKHRDRLLATIESLKKWQA
jgi:hypothetical protein